MYKAIAFKVHVNSTFSKDWTVLTKTMLAPACKMHYITSFSFNNTTSKMRSNLQ